MTTHMCIYDLKVYTAINNKCSNTVIMDYTNKDFTGNLNLENVLWIDGNLSDSKVSDCIVWDDIKVKL